MALDMITRRELGWPALSKNTNTDQGMIAHYDGSRGLLTNWRASGHTACVAYWKRTRAGHMNGNGWRDVGYAYFVCPCGRVFEGRGVDRIQAAESPTPGKIQGGNTRYVAVTFGTGPGELPTPEAVQGWHDLRDWLRSEHSVRTAVYGHRNFTSTSCPGEPVYDLVETGKLKIRPGAPIPIPESEDDPVAALPMLRLGVESNDVLTLRALLFQRFLSERFDPTLTVEIEDNEDYMRFFGWLRSPKFDPDLKADVIEYQKWRFPDLPSEWDGVVGSKTWAQLTRTR